MKITKSQLKNVIEETVEAIRKEQETDPLQDLKNIIAGLENSREVGTPPDMSDVINSLYDVYDRLTTGPGE